MKLTELGAAAVLAMSSAIAGAQTTSAATPGIGDGSRPIRWVVHTPPGTATDTMARIIGQRLSDQWGQPIVIDNRMGANGIIAARTVAKSEPNGLTWFMAYVGNHATNASFYKDLPYDPRRDFAAVATLGVVPFILVVPTSLPVANLHDLVGLARTKPGQLNFGGSPGSVNHLLGVMLNSMAGVDITHVPYKVTRDAVTDTVAGRIQVLYTSAVVALPLMQAGKLRGLAVTSGKRIKTAQDIPTIAESGFPGFDVTPWWGILVRAGTPKALITKINADVNKLLAQKEVTDRFGGAEPLIGTPEQFQRIVQNDIVKWSKVIKDSGITAAGFTR